MADRDLNIFLNFVTRQARQAAQQFHQEERRNIRETGQEHEAFLKRWSSLWRKLQEAKVKGVQDGYKKEEKAAQDAADKILAGARKQNDAQIKLMNQLREVRLKAIQEIAREEVRRQEQVEKNLRQLRDARVKAVQQAAQAEYKAQTDIANKLLADARSRQQAHLALSDQLREAKVKGAQAAFQSEEDYRKRMEKARVHAKIQMIRDTEERIRAQVRADEELIRLQLDGEERLAASKKEILKSTDSVRKAIEADRDAEEKDRTRKFISDQGFAQERREKAARKAGHVEQTEARKTTSALDRQQKQILSISQAYTTMRIAAEVGQFARMAFDGMADSLRESHDYIGKMVEDMERFRTQSREILAMRGDKQNAASIARFAAEAEAAGVNTQDYAKFVEEFQANTQEHIEPKGVAPGEAKNYRLTQDQEKSLNKFAVSFAASQGIDPRSAAQLMGTVIATSKVGPNGKVNEEEVRTDFAKIAGTLQFAKGRTSKLMPQFAEAAQELSGEAGVGVSDIKELAVQFGAGSEVNPNKSGVLIRALHRGLRQIRMSDKKSDELGITKNMTDEQALARAVAAIEEIAKSEGVSESEVTGRYFNEIREYEALRAHVVRGQRGGLYARARERQRTMTSTRAEQQVREFQASPEGSAQRQSAATDRAKFERAQVYEHLTAARRASAIDVIRAGEIELPENPIGAIVTSKGQSYGQGNRFEQETERITLQNVTQQLQMYEEGRDWLRDHGPLSIMSPEPVKAAAVNLLEELRANAAAGKPVRRTARMERRSVERKALAQLQQEGKVGRHVTVEALEGAPTAPQLNAGQSGGMAPAFDARATELPAARAMVQSRADQISGAGKLHARLPVGMRGAASSPARHHPHGPITMRARLRREHAREARRDGLIEILADADRERRRLGRLDRGARKAGEKYAYEREREHILDPARLAAAKARQDAQDTHEANAAYMAARRAAAVPKHYDPNPGFQSPDYGFGRGPLARATAGMLSQRGPDVQPKSFGDALAAWGSGNATPFDRQTVMAGRHAADHGSMGSMAGAGPLAEAARLLKQSVPAVPPSMPSKPHVIRN